MAAEEGDGKGGLMVAKELKRLQSNPVRFEWFMKTHVSRLLKSDLVAVLAEFQRQNLVPLSMKLYDVVRKETWYRPDMFFYRDMLMMLAETKRAFLDSGLLDEAMRIYDEMRSSPETPLSLPYRVILKGLIPYPELREQVKDDFLELFPDMIVYDPPEDFLNDDQQCRTESDED
ncbi:UNVERIFIED_CONTAM: Pentatricopeptide repeat-containing protein [Sesamum latifolium]|uniref:Pentatricopeptide repeat-containing protein n=1 Tax=Sesamum latifolium TaxID=2727402 RepID=A0AAW2VVG7_9LAMI